MTSVLEQMGKRFEQRVRKDVRDHVRAEKEPPPLTLWCSVGTDPRKLRAARVGAASSAAEVKAKIREQIREHRPRWVAIGRGVQVPGAGGGTEPVPEFGVVFISAEAVKAVTAALTGGKVGAWREDALTAQGRFRGDTQGDAWAFVQQALRVVEREREEGDVRERAARLLEGGGDGA